MRFYSLSSLNPSGFGEAATSSARFTRTKALAATVTVTKRYGKWRRGLAENEHPSIKLWARKLKFPIVSGAPNRLPLFSEKHTYSTGNADRIFATNYPHDLASMLT
jgi:hypothetical protein